MPTYRADWVVPVTAPPLRNGWVRLDGGRILAVGAGSPPQQSSAARDSVIDLGAAVILPSLVNAHTHLELSWMRGRVAPAGSMTEWVRQLLALRTGGDDERAIAPAIDEMRATGTGLVGDVSNTLASPRVLADRAMPGVVFYELLGFRVSDPAAAVDRAAERLRQLTPSADVRVALAAHAPYSVSPALLRAIAARQPAPTTVHVAESAEELRFLASGDGPWRAVLQAIGAWTADWQPPGTDPVSYLAAAGVLRRGTLAVHCVHTTRRDLERLAALGATVVTCPRSNAWVGAGEPPVGAFIESGVPVAVGTDSLASAPDVNLFSELGELRRIAPRAPASWLLQAATIGGARALGFGDELGSIEPGKRASLIAVSIEPRQHDIEEALAHGVDRAQVQWLGETAAAAATDALSAARLVE